MRKPEAAPTTAPAGADRFIELVCLALLVALVTLAARILSVV